MRKIRQNSTTTTMMILQFIPRREQGGGRRQTREAAKKGILIQIWFSIVSFSIVSSPSFRRFFSTYFHYYYYLLPAASKSIFSYKNKRLLPSSQRPLQFANSSEFAFEQEIYVSQRTDVCLGKFYSQIFLLVILCKWTWMPPPSGGITFRSSFPYNYCVRHHLDIYSTIRRTFGFGLLLMRPILVVVGRPTGPLFLLISIHIHDDVLRRGSSSSTWSMHRIKIACLNKNCANKSYSC